MKSVKNTVFIAAGSCVLIALIIAVTVKNIRWKDNNSYTLFSEDTSKIDTVSVEYNGETVTAENLKDSVWTINGKDRSEIDSAKAFTLASAVSTVISKVKIADGMNNSAQYGLDKPQLTVTITTLDGQTAKLRVGDMEERTGNYYISLDGDNSVYTLYGYKADILKQPVDYYGDFNRFNINTDDIIRISISRGDETAVLERNGEKLEYEWKMIQPHNGRVNYEYIENNILNPINELDLSAPASDKTSINSISAEVSFEIKPYDSIVGKYGENYTESLIIGDTDGDTAYVGYKDKIFSVKTDDVDFINIEPENMLDKMQTSVNINLIAGMSVIYENTDNLQIIRKGGENTTLMLNGNEADFNKLKKLYNYITLLAADGIYYGEPLGDTVLTLEFEGIKKSDNVIVQFNDIGGNNYAITRDNQTEFTISKNKIDEFLSKWREYVKNPQ